ncbi:snaclec coagulation factor IX/factor X-binding protein subunit A-like [Saccostrea echinata]|uniref:snaclec coagulation factor IX/factor X-binding protein subunit A-like n=1 Tax=Saccostrea echinata TaxID=191078 RepID=UPI002A7EB7D6|nr:snaclec coagulation factor IX/factor X-binding protein subunit A-like [Saccostrea echinata]
MGRNMCHDKCMLFGYNEKDKICYLHMQTQQNFLTDSEEGIMYYQKTEKGCGSQWLEYRNHCYFHNQMKATWTEAKLWCESRYAHLVEIESKEESDWLARTFLLKV